MTKFSNKSLYFSLIVGLVNLCLLFLMFVSSAYIYYLIFTIQAINNGQSGIVALGLGVFFLLISSLLFIVFLSKNFVYGAYLQFDQEGLELKYLSRSFKKIQYLLKWTEVEKIYDKIGATQYELVIETKEQKILLPFEIWQSIFRVSKIKRALMNYPVESNFKAFPRIALIVGDTIIITFLVVFIGIIVYSTLIYYNAIQF